MTSVTSEMSIGTVLKKRLRQFAKSKMSIVSALIFIAFVLAAIFAPFFSNQNPYDLTAISVIDSVQSPGSSSMEGVPFILGSDGQGRDIYSAILYGLRISLIVGLTSAMFAFILGSVFGLVAAYVGGRIENAMMRLVDLQLSFPTILVALLLLALLGKSTANVVVAIILVEWATYARTARGAALSEINKDYVEAARGLMLPRWRVVLVHILPNCLSPLIVLVTMQIARAITLEATLSFLGLGVPITEPSLGLLISNGFEYMLSGSYWISLFPGFALLLLVYSINSIGDRLREVLNPKEAV